MATSSRWDRRLAQRHTWSRRDCAPSTTRRQHSSFVSGRATRGLLLEASKQNTAHIPVPRVKHDSRRPAREALPFATSGFATPVGQDVVVAVGSNALLSFRRGYADPALEASPGAPHSSADRSRGQIRPRPARRQRCASPPRRRSGAVPGHLDGPAFPHEQESVLAGVLLTAAPAKHETGQPTQPLPKIANATAVISRPVCESA
jgi:hypothetical protein